MLHVKQFCHRASALWATRHAVLRLLFAGGAIGPTQGGSGWARLVAPTVLPRLKGGSGRGNLHFCGAFDKADNVRRSLPILIILLALTIAGREIPEISKLADDPSNDGQMIDLYAQALPQPVSQRAPTTKARPGSKRDFVFSPLEDCSSRPALGLTLGTPLGITGQQLLLFLTIQRT